MNRKFSRQIIILTITAVLGINLITAKENKSFTAIHKIVDSGYISLEILYKYLHANPELPLMEKETAKRMARELGAAGYQVTKNVGPFGVVGVLKNGPGPVLMIRTDMDALPIKEKTGLPYASTVRMKNQSGEEVDVMHSCGHDVHMTVFIGTARVMNRLKEQWSGTLVMVAQQAEELGVGARMLIKNGLFTRFPRPDFALALHDAPFPAGMVGTCEGFMLAGVDEVDITVFGIGGHGASPHSTKDPIVIASQLVMALQTIVSRELDPQKSAVITVGSIHGGTKHNIIPDQVKLQLTVRYYGDESRKQILDAIKRISAGVAKTAGLPDNLLPQVTIGVNNLPATYNDPQLTKKISQVFQNLLGKQMAIKSSPVMASEDFSEYGRVKPRIPTSMFWLGACDPKIFVEAMKTGKNIPGPHSPFWAPVPELTIKTGVTAMAAAALDILKK